MDLECGVSLGFPGWMNLGLWGNPPDVLTAWHDACLRERATMIGASRSKVCTDSCHCHGEISGAAN